MPPWRVLDALDEAAAQLGAPPAQIALAWQMARPGLTAPIASATSLAQLHDLLPAATLRLPTETMSALDRASQTTGGHRAEPGCDSVIAGIP